MSRKFRPLRGGWRCLCRLGVALACLLLVLLTVYVVAGRLLIPRVENYRTELVAELEAQLGADVRLDSLSGRWQGLGPVVEVSGLQMLSIDGDASHEIGRLTLRLDVAGSLLHRAWRFSDIIVSELDMDARERPDGSWYVQGIGLGGGLRDVHVDFLLSTGALHLRDSRLGIQRANGASLQLDNVQASLRNRGAGHELDLLVSLPEQANPLQLSLDFEGDPRRQPAMNGYLGIRRTEMLPLVELLAPSLPVQLESLSGDVRLWVSRQAEGAFSTTLSVDDAVLAVTGTGVEAAPVQLTALETTLSLSHRSDGGWQLRGDGASYRQDGESWRQGPFRVHYRPGEGSAPGRMALSADSIALSPLQPWLNLGGEALPGGEIIRSLAPRGTVTQLAMQLQAGDDPRFHLQAVVSDLGVDAWQHAPAGDGVDARLEVTDKGGVARIDSRDAELHLERLFNERWYWDRVLGDVYWEIGEDGFRVFSSPLTASASGVEARVQFEVDSRLDTDGLQVADLGLNIGIEEVDASLRSRFLPRIEFVRPVMDWLDQSLLAGDVRDSGLIYRGSTLSDPPPNSQATIALFRADDVSLAFLPSWPHVEQASTEVRLQHRNADIVVDSARLAGIRLQDIQGRVRQAADGPRLSLSAQGQADTATGLDFLRRTPIRDTLGDVLDDWQASGELAMSLDLGLPLSGELMPEIDLSVLSRDSRLQMTDLGLDIRDLDGELRYSSEAGLRADALQGMSFGRPLTTSIDTEFSEGGEQTVVVSSEGRVGAEALREWPGHPDFVRKLLGYVEGESPFRSEVRIATAAAGERPVSVEIESPLTGMAVSLPPPFDKPQGSEQPFSFLLDIFADRQVMAVELGNLISTRLLIRDQALSGGRVWLGGFSVDGQTPTSRWLPQNFVLLGELDQLDVRAWLGLVQGFRDPEAATPPWMTRLSLAEVKVATLQVGEEQYEDVLLRATPLQGGWSLFVENPLLSGTLAIPSDGSPWQAALQYLRLPAAEQPEADGMLAESEDALAEVDPRQLPALDISLAEFRHGERHFGRWELSLRPTADGARIDNLQVDLGEATIRGLDEASAGAELLWRYDGDQHRTSFNGMIEAANLADTLTSLGYDAHVESERARFASNLAWTGSPAAFALQSLTGEVLLRINEGRFVNIDSGSSRLFGVLNLDSLVRRLQLDFSDLFSRGFSYDRIDGELRFDNGLLSTMDRVLVSGPSSKIRLEGELDLHRQYIHADMLVTVPISQNITVLAGLLGAWPIALSTYLAGRIFEEQVEGLTAVAYRLEGPLNDLDAQFIDADELGEVAGEPLPPAPLEEPAPEQPGNQ